MNVKQIKTIRGNPFCGWKPFEVGWLVFATATVLVVSIFGKSNIIGTISALLGVWQVILCGKGKRIAFVICAINALLYAYISFQEQYFGTAIFNMLYYPITAIIGFVSWKKHMNNETGEVVKKRLSTKNSIILYLTTSICVLLCSFILKIFGGNLPFVDAMSTIVAIVAQILTIKRFSEQWGLWIAVDLITSVMWAINLAEGGNYIVLLVMKLIYLANDIMNYYKWQKEANTPKKTY